MIQGSFLFSLKTKSNQHVIGYPQPEFLEDKVIYLMRVRKSKGVPDQSSHLHPISQSIIESNLSQKASSQSQTSSLQTELARNLFFLLECEIIGTFSASISPNQTGINFSSDVGHISPAVTYHLFRPDKQIMNMVLNGMVHPENRIDFGWFRPSENESYLHNLDPIYITMSDIRGKRTAMFGKTRMGKSNVVKLIVQGMLDITQNNRNVGQLIFDVNGEYANNNPQDGADAIAPAYPDRCTSYFLTPRSTLNQKPKLLRFNFYERTFEALSVMRELLPPRRCQL